MAPQQLVSDQNLLSGQIRKESLLILVLDRTSDFYGNIRSDVVQKSKSLDFFKG